MSAFELLTGTVPFARGETWATVWAHQKTPPPALTALRPDLPHLTDPRGLGVDAMAFSADSQMLATADANGKTYLWDLRTRKLVAPLANPAGAVSSLLAGRKGYAVHSVVFSPNGSTPATGDINGRAYLWRVR